MRFFAALWRSESAQASTEYILLLFSAVMFFIMLVKTLQPIMAQVISKISTQLQNSLSSTGLYNFSLGK